MENKSNQSPGVMKDKSNKYSWHKLFLKAYKAMPQLFLESVFLSSLAFALSMVRVLAKVSAAISLLVYSLHNSFITCSSSALNSGFGFPFPFLPDKVRHLAIFSDMALQ